MDRPGQPLRTEFLKRVARHFANEVSVVTPNGELLAHGPAEALAKWRQLPVAQRKHLENLGAYHPELDPAPPPNGLIVNVYARALKRDASGAFQYYRGKADSTREAGRDHLWLTAQEWQSLLPARARGGQRYDVADAIVRRLCLRYLIPLAGVGGYGGPWAPEKLLARELHVTVQENSPTRVGLRLDGSCRVASARPEEVALGKKAKGDLFQLRGYLSYDATKKAITRFDIVAFSETGYYDCDSVVKLATPLAIAFELARGNSEMDRFPPFRFSPREYFGNVAPK